ncbi:30S ribosomal protein S6 [bacterium]|nr:30S ribosomal protein S6 [bacterium]
MYEGMFLLDSNRFSADPAAAQQAVLGMLERVGASVVASRPWQEGKLAYPIENHRKGLYYLACFKMDGGQMDELNRLGKLNETVLRQLVIRHEPVIFDAMVQSLTSNDGTIHSPEQKMDDRMDRGDRGDRPDRGGRRRDDDGDMGDDR